MMNGVRASGNWKTSIDELSVGDLVFPYANGGHVGVYVGNGEYIHAANPSRRGVVKGQDLVLCRRRPLLNTQRLGSAYRMTNKNLSRRALLATAAPGGAT